ncbi:hypothetical protein AVEN_147033-1, partial [Araneus ventricosus]
GGAVMGRRPLPPLVALVLLCLCWSPTGVTQKPERVEKGEAIPSAIYYSSDCINRKKDRVAEFVT